MLNDPNGNSKIHESRLDRIEGKIDKLSEAMISLARSEEKILALEQNNHNNQNRMNQLDDRNSKLEEKVASNSTVIRILIGLLMLTASGVVTLLIKMIGGS